MEAAILTAEEVVTERRAEVERSAIAGHVALTAACLALEQAREAVEQLYARWSEFDGKRG